MEEIDPKSVEKAREVLRARLFSINPDLASGKRANDFISNESTPQNRKEVYSTVKGILEDTIVNGSSASLLIQGPSGSGKTWLVNEVLKGLNSDPRCKDNYILVRLDGLVHTDDHRALLAIAAQLDLEHESGDIIQMPFTTAMNHLLETMKKGHRGKMSVVFVLDRFELFTRHKNQKLLYILFDVARTNCNPVAIVGLSRSVDATEMLEKRVKSRCFHKKIYLFFDYTFEDYMKIFKSLVSLPRDFGDKRFLANWKDRVEKLSKNEEALEVLKQMHKLMPGIHQLKLLLTVPVSCLSKNHPFLEPVDLSQSQLSLQRCSAGTALKELSVLELTLVIAMNHLMQLDDQESFNFEMVYAEYKRFTQRSHSSKLLNKSVAMKAFEHLVQLELVCPVGSWSSSAFLRQRGGARKTTKEYMMMKLMVMSGQVKEAVKSYPNCPTDLTRWGLELSMRTS